MFVSLHSKDCENGLRLGNSCLYDCTRLAPSLAKKCNMMEQITSLQNPKIKQLLLLQQKSSERRKTGLFVVEGQQELQHCLDAGYEVDTVFYCPELYPAVLSPAVLPPDNPAAQSPTAKPSGTLSPAVLPPDSRSVLPPDAGAARWFQVSPDVYAKVAYRGTTEGVIAEVRQRTLQLADLQLGEHPLIVVLESVEKPGNLGAILRSADASGVDAVVVCDPLTDLYNPNLIRSSVGAAFTVPCVACSSEDCIAFLKQRNIKILTAQLQDSHLYYNTDMTCGTAIVMGTEHDGLTDQWRQAADAHIRIPMLGRIDSLNVSVSAAILMFEAVRQRKR